MSRNHNSKNQIPQDPASFGPAFAAMAKNILNERYRFLPYLYTLMYKAHTNGETVVRPMMMEFPTDLVSRDIDEQFMWGSGLLIAPVLEENTVLKRVYFPDNGWWYHNGLQLQSNQWVEVEAPKSSYNPVFVRGGYCFMQHEQPGVNVVESMKRPFKLLVALGRRGEAYGDWYWDDGNQIELNNKKFFGMEMVNYQRIQVAQFDNTYNSSIPMILGSVEILGFKPSGPSFARIGLTLNEKEKVYLDDAVFTVDNENFIINIDLKNFRIDLNTLDHVDITFEPRSPDLEPESDWTRDISCLPERDVHGRTDFGSEECFNRGCIYVEDRGENDANCYFSMQYGYKAVAWEDQSDGTTFYLEKRNSKTSMYANPYIGLAAKFELSPFTHHGVDLFIKPGSFNKNLPKFNLGYDPYAPPKCVGDGDIKMCYNDFSAFPGMHIQDAHTGEVLADLSGAPMIFDQGYTQFTVAFEAGSRIYGLGEGMHKEMKRQPGEVVTIWSREGAPSAHTMMAVTTRVFEKTEVNISA